MYGPQHALVREVRRGEDKGGHGCPFDSHDSDKDEDEEDEEDAEDAEDEAAGMAAAAVYGGGGIGTRWGCDRPCEGDCRFGAPERQVVKAILRVEKSMTLIYKAMVNEAYALLKAAERPPYENKVQGWTADQQAPDLFDINHLEGGPLQQAAYDKYKTVEFLFSSVLNMGINIDFFHEIREQTRPRRHRRPAGGEATTARPTAGADHVPQRNGVANDLSTLKRATKRGDRVIASILCEKKKGLDKKTPHRCATTRRVSSTSIASRPNPRLDERGRPARSRRSARSSARFTPQPRSV